MKKTPELLSVLGLMSLFAAGPSFAADKVEKVQLTVTEEGFQPAAVKVKKGQPVALEVTRKTDQTCAHHIVIDKEDVKGGEAIRKELPLNKTVAVTFTPAKSGDLKYGCGMNKMVGGVLSVQ